MKKVKIFLGAYVNQTNAQNLNCRALATHLDKSKFEVYTLTIGHGNLGQVNIPEVKVFNCRYPVKITQYFGFFWGIMNCDIAYLPRGNDFELQRFFVKLFNRKSFKTVENIFDDESLKTALAVAGTFERAKEMYSYTKRTYSITSFMRRYNFNNHNLSTCQTILPPLIETSFFKQKQNIKSKLRHLVFIGNDMKRKRVDDFVQLANRFPSLNFHIVGRDGHGYLAEMVKEVNSNNLEVYGLLKHEQLLNLLERIDLHVLTSRSEGFPKGIIECAAAGIPSLVYDDYGADEWIVSGENGIVCKTLSEMETAIEDLLNNHDQMTILSKGAAELAERFNVMKVAKLYEEVIQDIHVS